MIWGRSKESAGIRLLRAALTDDRAVERMAAGELRRGVPVAELVAGFVVAARRRFDDGLDRRVLHTFARRFAERVPGFLVRHAEAALRGVTAALPGDPRLLTVLAEQGAKAALRGMPVAVRGDGRLLVLAAEPEMYFALTLAIADDLEWDADDVEALLDEVRQEIRKATALAVPPWDEPIDVLRHRRLHQRLLSDDDLVPARETPPRAPRPLTGKRGPGPATPAGRHMLAFLTVPDPPSTDGIDRGDLFRIARATLSEALWDFLPPDPDVREIAALVEVAELSCPDDYRDRFDPMMAEYTVRLNMGEPVPLDGMTKRHLYGICGVLLQYIALVSERDKWAMRALVVAAERQLVRTSRSATP